MVGTKPEWSLQPGLWQRYSSREIFSQMYVGGDWQLRALDAAIPRAPSKRAVLLSTTFETNPTLIARTIFHCVLVMLENFWFTIRGIIKDGCPTLLLWAISIWRGHVAIKPTTMLWSTQSWLANTTISTSLFNAPLGLPPANLLASSSHVAFLAGSEQFLGDAHPLPGFTGTQQNHRTILRLHMGGTGGRRGQIKPHPQHYINTHWRPPLPN